MDASGQRESGSHARVKRLDCRQRLTKHETHIFTLPRIVDNSRDLGVDEPHRGIHGTKLVRLWGSRKPIPWKVLGQQGSVETFVHATYRHPKGDIPHHFITREDKRKSWGSHAKDQRP